MYWSGWEMGAVEAISLSILVGSSVDYCVHLVEGYLLAGENLPLHQAEVSSFLPFLSISFLLSIPFMPSMPLGCDAGPQAQWSRGDVSCHPHSMPGMLAACPADWSETDVHLSTVNPAEGAAPCACPHSP